MKVIPKSSGAVTVIGVLVLLLGISMVVYWVMYIVRQMPMDGVPVLSESVTALLALVTGFGVMRRKPWVVPFTLVLCGMWAYGVIAGIALVLKQGLSFDSPFGAATDALLFPLVLLFALWVAATTWMNRAQFTRPPNTDT